MSNENRNASHGHVTPRPDGAKARCGGPPMCKECCREQAALAATPQQPAQAETLNDATRDQIAAVMLMHGTPEQQREVAAYCGINGKTAKERWLDGDTPEASPAQADSVPELLQALIAATDLLHGTVKSSDRTSDYVMRAVAGFRALIAKAAAIQAPEAAPAQAPVLSRSKE